MNAVEAAIRYHERTKHRFNRFAPSLGYMDWANQPVPFRVFEDAPVVPLPFAADFPAVTWSELPVNASRPGPLTLEVVSDFLMHSLAISAWKQAGDSRWALRVNPSSGNLHPTEGYLVLPALDGLSEAPGVYHYRALDHVLHRRAELTDEGWAALTVGLPEGSFLVGLTSILWREAWKYGERAFRYCQHDTGHALAALSLAAALTGRKVALLDGWSHDALGALLGTDRDEDFPVAEEREEPELLITVSGQIIRPTSPAASPRGTRSAQIGRFALTPYEYFGSANRLSREHHPWEAIEIAARATEHPGGDDPAEVELPERRGPGSAGDGLDARALIRQRRSAVDFDGRSRITLSGFQRILGNLLPAAAPPWNALAWEPSIHLAIFVHRVEGLAPGIYLLLRRPSAETSLREALRDEFLWQRPEGLDESIPLFLLSEGDQRHLAARLSCTQEIAGDSFFSLGMLAEFEGRLRERGASAYRRLFWEAGMVGQMLYLTAEAEGARGTGIGCYFDDAVHEVLGLRDRAFQSLYHFTVGIAVEDERLSMLPAYAEPLIRTR